MAHFAGVNNEDKVLHVVVVSDEHENDGDAFLKKLTINMPEYGDVVEWIQTSYNTQANQHVSGKIALRGNFAGIGFSYLRDHDVFIDEQPYASWILNQSTWRWVAPIPMPADENLYFWDEQKQSWQIIE